MLVLDLKPDSEIVIDLRLYDLGLIKIKRCRGKKSFRLGFTADPKLPIHRDKVFQAIEQAKNSKGAA